MTDTRKEFDQFVLDNMRTDAPNFINERIFAEKSWQACQSLNDKRIQQLLAVIEKKDEALKLLLEFKGMIEERSGDYETNKASEALAIKPEDVELVEVGGFVMHEDKIGTRYPSSQMSYNYDEFEIGALNKLYTIKQKG